MSTRYLVAVLLVVAATIGAYLLITGQDASPLAGRFLATSTAPAAGAVPREVPAGFAEYRTAQYRFTLLYPSDLVVEEYSEDDGASTVTFQNIGTGHGFQIFIAPYGLAQITDEQFRKDEPSGVRTDTKDAVIDKAKGASFYSTNAALGDTAEVWFIHGGYLYEVTTLKPLAPWLNEIMQSWKFI
jgi:hypothetical protein